MNSHATRRERPDDRRERALGGRVAGIDEVGRGPLAGPVVAAAVILPPGLAGALIAAGLDDSKRVPPARRQKLDALIRAEANVGLAMVDVATIDSINILQASLLAMRQALSRLAPAPDAALIDGNRLPEGLPCPAEAVIGGDRRCAAIAAAAIVAKTARDAEMARLAKAFPAYGWERNAGYGTAEHLRALRSHGPTPHHRRSFAPVAALVNDSSKTA